MKRTILVAITLLLAITLQAQKRVNNRLYNPDPAPVVSGDRLYVLGLCFHSVKPMLSLSQNIVFTICLASIRNLLDGNP